MYNKYGKHIQTFSSNFPGGNRINYRAFTVLDCIFNQEKECYFVIDLLAWNGISFREADVRNCYTKKNIFRNDFFTGGMSGFLVKIEICRKRRIGIH